MSRKRNITNCKICGHTMEKLFVAKVLNKYNVEYFYCPDCGFIQTEEPYWLKEAYKNPINTTDTGILSRNIGLSQITAIIICFLFNKDGKFLDFAGGYGIFTRLMRDIGFGFYWYDPYCTNLLARGFKLKDEKSKFDLITAFEVFEHFVEPIKNIEKMLQFSDNIFFSTQLLPSPISRPEEWWYYGLEHGQHISFYSLRTLNHLAQKYNMNLCSNNRNLHLLTKSKNINKRKFNFLVKFQRFGLFLYVKRKMKSLTMDDMNFLKQKF